MEKIRFTLDSLHLLNAVENNPLPFIQSLYFSTNDHLFKDCCLPSTAHTLSIFGQGFGDGITTKNCVSISPAPVAYCGPIITGCIYQYTNQHINIQFITSEALLQFLPDKNNDFLEQLCLGSLNTNLFSPPDSRQSSGLFFLMDKFSIQGKFELTRISLKRPVWHLYISSAQKTVIIDCSSLLVHKLEIISPKIIQFYFQIRNLHMPFIQNLSIYSPSQAFSNLPPSYAFLLHSPRLHCNDSQISQVLIPPLRRGRYIIWVTILEDFVVKQSISKGFIVEKFTH